MSPTWGERRENPNSTGRFLGIRAVARELGVRPDDVYRLIRRGELPAVKLGGKGCWRIERSALDAHRRD